MTSHRYVAGSGPLTYDKVLREAWGMFRSHGALVALVALVVFVPPPLLAAVLGEWRLALEADPGLIRGLGFLVGVLTAVAIRLFGPVVYAGFLDEAVGKEYFHGEKMSLRQVLRRLPWGRLVVADIILVIGATIGLALFVVPAIIWLTLFALIGPVMVQERHGVIGGYRRTLQLSLKAWPKILLLVVALLAIENVVHEIVHQLFHHSSIWVQVAGSWAVAAFVGGLVGLVEVALATELIARDPLPESETAPASSPEPGA